MRLATGFDLETTGFLEPEHRILEIALVLYDLDTHQRLQSFVRRFNPGRPIDPKATEVHGITFEQVAMLPLLQDDAESIDYIQRILDKSTVVIAHNGDAFDKPFLAQEFARIGKQLPYYATVDTMLQGKWATPYGKSPNLRELAFACDVPYDVDLAHAAEYDVDVTMKCFFKGLKDGFYTLPNFIAPAPEVALLEAA